MLKAFDLFRHVPKDLTEASKIGGLVSMFAISSLCILCFLEIRSLSRVNTRTRIEVSHHEDDDFRVNLNFSFPGISCDWISIDLLDVVGHKKTNITSSTVHKYTLHGNYVASAVRSYGQAKPAATVEDPKAEVEVQKEPEAPIEKKVMELGPDNFDSVVNGHRVALVNFYAPWCPHCVHFAPIYDAGARAAMDTIHNGRDLVFGAVDCTTVANRKLCNDNHIQAFPTVRVFRDASDNPMGGKHGHMHEEYRGERSPDAVSSFALQIVKEVVEQHPRPEVQAHVALGTADDPKGKVSGYSAFGCMVVGYLEVSRVPGSIIFTPHAANHNFFIEAINMSHIITHLSFGKSIEEELETGSKKTADAIKNNAEAAVPTGASPLIQSLPKRFRKRQRESGPYAAGIDHTTMFLSLGNHITHEHYLKVVPQVLEPLWGKTLETYEYTLHSNLYEAKVDEVPSAKIVWDISPMAVVVTEERKPLVEGICQMVGFLGGVFTFFMMFEGVLWSTWQRLKKGNEGKLS